MLLYNGTEWVVFIDDYATLTRIGELIDQVTEVESQITSLQGNTVNSIPITQNPVLTGDNLKTAQTGTFIQSSDNLSDALIKLDLLLTTQRIQ